METKLMNNYFNNQLIIAAIYLALIWNLFLSMCACVCASLHRLYITTISLEDEIWKWRLG